MNDNCHNNLNTFVFSVEICKDKGTIGYTTPQRLFLTPTLVSADSSQSACERSGGTPAHINVVIQYTQVVFLLTEKKLDQIWVPMRKRSPFVTLKCTSISDTDSLKRYTHKVDGSESDMDTIFPKLVIDSCLEMCFTIRNENGTILMADSDCQEQKPALCEKSETLHRDSI